MCRLLNYPRATFYRKTKAHKDKIDESIIREAVVASFNSSKGNYGSRRIKVDIANKNGLQVSRRRIRRIMKENFLISTYQDVQFKVCHKVKEVNRENITNVIDRRFNNRLIHEVLISDLTYIRIGHKVAYICCIEDLFNREIVGWSIGYKKTPSLVLKAFLSITSFSLEDVTYFHTDRGSEFKNEEIDNLLKAYNIRRSLSNPGVPYDNACMETLYNKIKIEFVKGRSFPDYYSCVRDFFEYVHWYNYERIHEGINYMTPIAYKEMMSKSNCLKNC